jgi:hypothetical protein
MSIAAIFASVIVNAISEMGLPSAAATTLTAPLINAGRVTWANRVPDSVRGFASLAHFW